MARIIAVTNQKGGVGKTATSVNLAASLSATKRKVLLVDLDPQGNATMGSGVNKYETEKTSYDILLGRGSVAEVKTNAQAAGYDLISANGDLTAAEVELLDEPRREYRLQQALAVVAGGYDYILIDCPPSLSMLTVNAMVAADGVIVPMQCEYYALEGLSALLETIENIRAVHNESLAIEGLLRTMFDPRNNLANEVSDQLKTHFGDKLYRTIIPRNVRIAEAPSYGLPVFSYDKSSRGAQAYLALAGEIIGKERRRAAAR